MAKKKEAPLEFHPLSESYPLMSESELEVLVVDMQKDGFDPRFPIVLYEGKILAGRDRYRASQRAGVSPRVVPLAPGEDAKRFVERENENRKHFTQEFLAKKREERIERIAQARADGESTRTIAEREGVSQPQVLRDLASGDTPVSPETQKTQGKGHVEGAEKPKNDQKVKGKDGKTYPAKKPKKVIPPPGAGDSWEPTPEEVKASKVKNGKPLFDDKLIYTLMGKLIRAVDDRGRHYPGKKKCADIMDQFAVAWKEWQKGK